MKVLLFTDESIYEHEWLALGRRLERMIDLLQSRGLEVSVLTLRAYWELHERLIERGIPAYTLGLTNYARAPLAVLRLSRALHTDRPDIVHSMGPLCTLLSGLSRFVRRGPVRIYDRSHVSGRCRLDVGSRVAARLTDHTIAWSQAVRSAAIQLDRSDPNHVSVVYGAISVPRPVSDQEATAIRATLMVPDHLPLIGIVGRLRSEKGHLTLIEALQSLAVRSNTMPHLLVVGAGPNEQGIRDAANSATEIRAHFVGHQDDISPWMAAADVLVMPSYQEAFGKVAAEALCAGKPLIASRVGGIPEVVEHRVNGLLVPPKDPAALADALEQVLSSESLRHSLARAGKKTGESFSPERRVAGWMAAYVRALGEAPERQATEGDG